MRLTPPTFFIWFIALVVGVLGIIFHLGVISVPAITNVVSSFWMVTAGFVLLVLSTLLKGI